MNLEKLEDFLVHLFSALTDVNVIRFSHERVVVCGVVGVQIAPVDGQFTITASGDGFEPVVIKDEFEAANTVFDIYCLLLREVLTEEYFQDADEPPEPETKKD